MSNRDRIQVAGAGAGSVVEVAPTGSGRVELRLHPIGSLRALSVELPAHQVHELAAQLVIRSLETLHQVTAPASYDLVFTLSSRTVAAERDTRALLAALEREREG